MSSSPPSSPPKKGPRTRARSAAAAQGANNITSDDSNVLSPSSHAQNSSPTKDPPLAVPSTRLTRSKASRIASATVKEEPGDKENSPAKQRKSNRVQTQTKKSTASSNQHHSLLQSLSHAELETLITLPDPTKLPSNKNTTCICCGQGERLHQPPRCCDCQEPLALYRTVYVGEPYLWCLECYEELVDGTPIELPDGATLVKTDLVEERITPESLQEPWVQCDQCHGWVHQRCGLFNARQDGVEEESEYHCPHCLLDRPKAVGKSLPRPPGAAELPMTALSKQLQQSVSSRSKLAEQLSLKKEISLAAAKKEIELGGSLIVREVASTMQTCSVGERMQQRYKSYPAEFRFRRRCIVVFQRLDGVDVMLCAMFVDEYGQDNPPPNKGKVYLSYLDSIHHVMLPAGLSTIVYHEVLTAYLDDARRRGFGSLHIWSCPPLRDQCYAFNVERPLESDQNRLQRWYYKWLAECAHREIVGNVTNLYDCYIADETLDASKLPYLEGDHFANAADDLITEIERSKKSTSDQHTHSSSPDQEGDPLKTAFGKKIQSRKDRFIVASLNALRALATSEEEELDGGPLNNPHKFLVFCRAHNYQFDSLRSLKHSSMMVLWHLHNR